MVVVGIVILFGKTVACGCIQHSFMEAGTKLKEKQRGT
jgi:hypothetical protein